jgi:preprotein translocase subunit SecE
MARKETKDAVTSGEKPAASGLAVKAGELKEYFEQSKAELKKTTWPSRKETIATSTAVIVLVIIMSIFLGLVDLGLAKAIEAILS